MQDICDNLNTFYNTNILDDAAELQQASFYKVCKDNKNNKKGNTVLKRLILNHYTKSKPVFSQLSGPLSLTVHYSKKYHKKIYIFGEFHMHDFPCVDRNCSYGQVVNPKTYKCISDKGPIANTLKSEGFKLEQRQTSEDISDYFEELFKNTDVFIDFYVEFPAFQKRGYYLWKKYYSPGTLRTMMDRFAKCIETVERVLEEDCALIRAHYIDIRRTSTINFGTQYFINKFRGINETNVKALRIEINVWTLRPILLTMGESKDIIIKYFIDEYENSSYNKKEVAKSTLSKKIDKWVKKKIIERVNIYYIGLQSKTKILLNPKINDEVFISNLKQLTYELIDISFLIVDSYTLARIFRKFDVKNTNQPVEPSNIIIYAGNFHSNNYREFLTDEGFTEISSVGKTLTNDIIVGVSSKDSYRKSKKCLYMNKIPQPFFNTVN